jgi:hypothetical protein
MFALFAVISLIYLFVMAACTLFWSRNDLFRTGLLFIRVPNPAPDWILIFAKLTLRDQKYSVYVTNDESDNILNEIA